jgi:hypothetical protein
MDFDDVVYSVSYCSTCTGRYVDVSNRDVGLHSGRRELLGHTTPHLISNSTLESYAHISRLGVLNVIVLPRRVQMTTCIISMKNGEQFAIEIKS